MVEEQSSAPPDAVVAWFPQYEEFGYSRVEAEQLVGIAERLWIRYTARGLTLDSEKVLETALEPFEVLIQSIYHFGVAELAGEHAHDIVANLRKRKRRRRTADRAGEIRESDITLTR